MLVPGGKSWAGCTVPVRWPPNLHRAFLGFLGIPGGFVAPPRLVRVVGG